MNTALNPGYLTHSANVLVNQLHATPRAFNQHLGRNELLDTQDHAVSTANADCSPAQSTLE
jgi:hypothetical protein